MNYQTLPGEPEVAFNKKIKNSKFWDGGKFDTFIKPLLPKDPTDMIFLEFGCNAGLFVKMAKDYGFSKAIGVEKDTQVYERGKNWRDKNGYDYELINASIEDFLDNMPLVDVVLLSNVHYYLSIPDWMKLIDILRTRCTHLIIVNKYPRARHHLVFTRNIERYFTEWSIPLKIDNVNEEGDPSPRKLRSILFKSPIVKRVKIDDTHSNRRAMLNRFYSNVKNKEAPDEYRRYLRSRYKVSSRRASKILREKAHIYNSMKLHGQSELIVLDKDNIMVDGSHRASAQKALGCKTILARYV